MTNQHPITPSPELVREWTQNRGYSCADELWDYLAAQAAQWGADQELEACIEWFQSFYCMETWMQKDLAKLRDRRRPKPPSLKEQALDALREAESSGCLYVNGRSDTIRKALEALPND